MSKQTMTVSVNGTSISVEFNSTVTILDTETGSERTARQAIIDCAETAESTSEFAHSAEALGCDAEVFDCE